MLPALELSFVGFIVFVFLLTQLIIPLWCDLPCFWMFSRVKRLEINLVIRGALASDTGKNKNKNN